MLLKDSGGDIGILKAQWVGAKPGVPGVPGIPGTRKRGINPYFGAIKRKKDWCTYTSIKRLNTFLFD